MDLQQQLRKFGLSISESTVYIFLLQNGLTTPPTVSHETMIARTNCYNILNSLEEKGLIEERLEGKRKVYFARSPESIIQMLEKQREAAMRVLPDLEAIYTLQRNKPITTYFAGWDEIRALFYQTFEAKRVRFIGQKAQLESGLPQFYQFYIDELQKRGVDYSQIDLSAISDVSRETFSQLTTTHQNTTTSAPTLLLLWDEHVSFITISEPVFATTMKNTSIADTFYVLFNVLRGK